MKKDGTWLLSTGHFLNDFYCNFLPILLPIIMPQLGISLTVSGLLVMVLSITSNMMQPVFGYVMDRHNLSRILIPVIPFGAICICSIGLISTKAMLFIIIALTGLSVSAFHPLGSTLVAKTAPSERQGRSMSYYIAGGNLGYALAPIIVIAFLDRFSMAELPWLMVPAFLFAFVCLKSGLTRFSTVAEQAKGKVFHLREVFHNAAILRLNLAMGLRCCTHVSMSTLLPLLLVSHGYSGILSGTLLTFFLVGCTLPRRPHRPQAHHHHRAGPRDLPDSLLLPASWHGAAVAHRTLPHRGPAARAAAEFSRLGTARHARQ